MIHMGGRVYELIIDHRNAYNYEAFRDRYSEVLERYDYIVGDWGYNQLRLKGFFKENNQKSTRDTTVAGLNDYLNEYCNFGCAYFVLERTNAKSPSRSLSDAPEDEEDGSAQSQPGIGSSGPYDQRSRHGQHNDSAKGQGQLRGQGTDSAQASAGPDQAPPSQELQQSPRHRHHGAVYQGQSQGAAQKQRHQGQHTSQGHGGPGRHGRPDRHERAERQDRHNRPDKPERGDRQERPDRDARPQGKQEHPGKQHPHQERQQHQDRNLQQQAHNQQQAFQQEPRRQHDRQGRA